ELEIKVSEFAKLWILTVPLLLARCEIDQHVEVPHITLAQKLIFEYGAQRWRQRHREFERHRVVHQTLHHAQQRNVTFRYRLEQPLFFEKMLVFRMANERKMRVENEREVTHCRFQISNCGLKATRPKFEIGNLQSAITRSGKSLGSDPDLF